MRVLDLFAGTGSATRAFAEAGDEVVRVELDTRFPVDHRGVFGADLWNSGPYDFIWASPPCTTFSVASFRHHWRAQTSCSVCGAELVRVGGERWEGCVHARGDGRLSYTPKSRDARIGLGLLRQTLTLVQHLAPRWFLIENPVGLMRKMLEVQGLERRTITHCQYGDPRRMKPTDLFGVFPDGFEARACSNGSPCHEAAPRGAKTGTQGLSTTEAGMLPPLLGEELRAAMVVS